MKVNVFINGTRKSSCLAIMLTSNETQLAQGNNVVEQMCLRMNKPKLISEIYETRRCDHSNRIASEHQHSRKVYHDFSDHDQ